MAKTKRGSLSTEDKGRIIYLLQTLGDNSESHMVIAKDIGRSISLVEKAIKEMKSVFVAPETDANKIMTEQVVKMLVKNGLSETQARSKIVRVFNELSKEQIGKLTEGLLFQYCLKLSSGIDFFAGNKNRGVTLSTETASQRADMVDITIKPPKNPAIFKINDEI